jgi:hypothetical protein
MPVRLRSCRQLDGLDAQRSNPESATAEIPFLLKIARGLLPFKAGVNQNLETGSARQDFGGSLAIALAFFWLRLGSFFKCPSKRLTTSGVTILAGESRTLFFV